MTLELSSGYSFFVFVPVLVLFVSISTYFRTKSELAFIQIFPHRDVLPEIDEKKTWKVTMYEGGEGIDIGSV